MDFLTKLVELSTKIKQQKSNITTEEATKTAFILPFISRVLGYDIFDPTEVIPEYVCDIGTKKGEKIDYAIMINGQVQILMECKKLNDELNINHAGQLFRYFHVTNARIGVLTNGQIYKFFTDLDNKNKMDEKPFLILDLLSIDENVISELQKISKDLFDIDSIVSSAGELKYIGQIKRVITAQFNNPDPDFVEFFSRRVYDGTHTQRVREQFMTLTKKSLSQFLNDQANERLKSAISTSEKLDIPSVAIEAKSTEVGEVESDIVTTSEEMDGYLVVKAVARSVLSVDRIVFRDAKSYFSVLIDNNNRKPICRLYMSGKKKYIGLFDDSRNEIRHEIGSIDDIYKHAEQIVTVARLYQ